MTRRRTITAALERHIIQSQLAYYGWVLIGEGAYIKCPLCQEPIAVGADVIHEHMVPLFNGGADDHTNIRIVHKECAEKKTNGGKAKATYAGSDKHMFDKGRRLRGEVGNGPKRKIPQPANPWQKGRKMKSRNNLGREKHEDRSDVR